MLILGFFDGVIEDILTAVYSVLIGICGGIYNVAAFAFKIFLILANAEVLEPQTYAILLNNVYALIGVVMLFIIAFALLKMMINSDEQKKSSSTIKKVIINSITSIMLIAILPTIFSFALDFQRSILCSNVIGRIFGIGNLGEMQCDPDNEVRQVQVAANAIVNGVFTSFFNVGQANLVNLVNIKESSLAGSFLPQEPPCGPPKSLNSNQDLICAQWNVLPNNTFSTTVLYMSMMYVEQSGDFFHYASYGRAVARSQIDFNFLVCLIGGLILIYVAVTYCFDMAIRLIKLTFYQIIAPIPILFKIIPEGKLSGMFGNWVKVTITCYLEVFIRIFILYAVIYMAKAVTNSSFFTEDLWHYGVLEHFFAKAFTYLGLVMFIKQAPKLISEVTGIDSGNMKLGLREKLKESGLFAAGSAIGGLFAGGGVNVAAAYRAGRHGWKEGNFKGIGAEATRRRENKEAKRQGSTIRGRLLERSRNWLGYETGVEKINRQLEEGIDPNTRNAFVATNDTANEIILRDNNGQLLGTIGRGVSLNMDRNVQEQIATSKQYYNQLLSQSAETVRHISESEQSNAQFISLRSALKKEAEEKVAEEKSSIEDTITAGGFTFTGNLASMYEYRDQRKLNGATDDELKEITKQIGLAKDRMWKSYASGAINGSIDNGKISNISDQISLLYSQGGLQENAGIAYDRTTDSLGLNALSGLELVEELDKTAKGFNNNLVLQKQNEENTKATIQEQNTGLERLSAQLKEQQELVKHSSHYRATQANVNRINKGGK